MAAADELSGVDGLRAARLRAFVAVEVPAAEALCRFLSAARETMPGFRWVEPANLHVTLRFLGQLERCALDRLITELRGVRAQPFTLGLAALGTFGSRRSPRVIWVGVGDGAEALIELAAGVEAACRRAGSPPVGRPFRPHLTLARARDRRGAPLAPLPPFPALPPSAIREIVLFESRPGPAGARYVPISSQSLEPALS